MRGRDAGVVGEVVQNTTSHRPQVATPGPYGRTNVVVGQAIAACGGVAPRRLASVRGTVVRLPREQGWAMGIAARSERLLHH